jgi:hypothetical protein
MCKWGTYEEMELTIPAYLSYTGKARKKLVKIDKCIAPIIRALNDGGIKTIGSCCGHGKRLGDIALETGQWLIITPDKKIHDKIIKENLLKSVSPKDDDKDKHKPDKSLRYRCSMI